MGQHHHHHHAPAPEGTDPRVALRWALGLNAGFLVVELVVGLWTGSLAVLSDATHMLSDVGALVLALAASELARQPSTARMTFGLARAEVMGAFINGLVLIGAAIAIVVEALHRVQGPLPDVPGWPVLLVGVVGLAINLGSVYALFRSDSNNLNIRGALFHMLADALGSVGAIVAAVGLILGFPIADIVMSVIVVVLVVWGAVRILQDAGRVLLQLPPEDLDVAEMSEALWGLPGVVAVHDLHAWTLDGQHPIVTAHLVIDESTTFEGACHAATQLLEDEFDVAQTTIQPERVPGCERPARGVCVGSGLRVTGSSGHST